MVSVVVEAHGDIGTYRFWFTQTNRTRWETREPQSNETLDTTFVYGDWRVIYNAGVMYSGSPFHTPLNTGPLGVPCDYQLAMPSDDAMLGETARSCEPFMRQVFIARSAEIEDDLAFERKLYVIRKRA